MYIYIEVTVFLLKFTIYMETAGVMQWDKYVQCGRHICSGAYANNVKCMYTSAPGHIVDCSEFICMQTQIHTF